MTNEDEQLKRVLDAMIANEDEGLKRVLDAMTPTDEEVAAEAKAERAAAVGSALEDAKAWAEAKAAEAKEPWTAPAVAADPKREDVGELAVTVDPENAHRWLLLANRIGAGAVVKLLSGGVRGVRGLAAAEKAVEAELERDKRTAEFIGGGRPLTAEELAGDSREALLYAGGAKWLPGGVVGLVVAGGGSGKTTWLAELAVRVSHGKNWPGIWDLARGPYAKGPVLLVMAEEDAKGAAYQISRACKVAGVKDAPDVHVWTGAEHDTALGQIVQLEDPVRGRVTTVVPSPFHVALCAKADAEGALLVILDPINQLLPTGGSENDAITAGALIRLAGEIRAAAQRGRTRMNITSGPDPVVLLAHHERKAAGADAGSDAARGSTAFIDNARWAVRMTRDRVGKVTRQTWDVTKSNYTRAAAVDAKVEWDETKRGIGFEWLPWGNTEEAAFRAAELAQIRADAKRKGEEAAAVADGKRAGANAYKDANPDSGGAPDDSGGGSEADEDTMLDLTAPIPSEYD
jgi:hypothetical protein